MRADGAANNGPNQASRLASEAGIDSGAFRSIGGNDVTSAVIIQVLSSPGCHRAAPSGHGHHG